MIGIGAHLRILLAVEPVDFRMQHNGLWSHVELALKEDPRSHALFGFTNRNRNRVKLLYWDGSGICLFTKVLEKGRFSWPRGSDKEKLSLSHEALVMLLEGINLKDGCQKAWYER